MGRQVDKTKQSNIKCEHCIHYVPGSLGKMYCELTGIYKNYWNRCKKFVWAARYNTNATANHHLIHPAAGRENRKEQNNEKV